MMQTAKQFRSFNGTVRLLVINQFTINLGFYMLIPYLAAHLSGGLGLATWLVGLVLGVRNFAQQGMFLIGGTLADRLGCKPLIIAGCSLRTAGFALLGVVDSVPALLLASAATGFAGALFNPAVRAHLSHEAGDRRVEAFALFNIFYQSGILLGPLVGMALTGIAFQATCFTAAAVFAVLTALQIRALPQRKGDREETGGRSVLADWRSVVANRSFVAFSVVMIGSYVLSFQVYLALPLEARRLAGDGMAGTAVAASLFAVSGLLAIAGQLRITAWCERRWDPGVCLVVGLLVMGAAFLPPLLTAGSPTATTTGEILLRAAPLVLSAALIGLAQVIVFPFEMDTIVTLAGNRLIATHYGLYNTVCGIGIMLGNLATGSVLDLARSTGLPALPWVVMSTLGLLCAGGIAALQRARKLSAPDPQPAIG
ncbi:Major Facilitator Superfamily protein [Saccharopolyspora kobensis]|uniref:Major Facilitator Superfamily protein n=2 Tax=Saccharopolyspora kobensis TaxID=146035 RepID=A0A1H6AAU2_9PSEU|nr:Major Facilitator Superfamily protein [Saccharopolyspora kobensis]SFE52642.1 Major Facilitator Superfamily protein [Saccharopolyspora kobensis]